jgi:LysR family glycine cleavage system transcriptional activator
MKTKLPSIASLLSFESVARNSSFTRAAIELNLTQTAISHQIKNLEELLGEKLFVRASNQLTLTQVGEDYLHIARDLIVNLSTATDRIVNQQNKNILTIECLGMFAIKRLMPRLPEFTARYPKIKLRLKTMQVLQSNIKHNFDIAIWHGSGNWIGVDSVSLGKEEIFPVCSPDFLRSTFPMNKIEDLFKQTILRTVSPVVQDEWQTWLQAAGIKNKEFKNIINCDYLITTLHAASAGLGIALGRSTVVDDDIASGKLVEPFTFRQESIYNYHLVSPHGNSELEKVQTFKNWLLESLISKS